MLEEGKEDFWDAASNAESGVGSRPVSLRPGSTIYGSILYNSWRMSRPISVISTSSFDARQRNRQSRPISMQLEHPISRYYPVFTIAITVAICTSPRLHCLPLPPPVSNRLPRCGQGCRSSSASSCRTTCRCPRSAGTRRCRRPTPSGGSTPSAPSPAAPTSASRPGGC